MEFKKTKRIILPDPGDRKGEPRASSAIGEDNPEVGIDIALTR